jgi:hypothetical protein
MHAKFQPVKREDVGVAQFFVNCIGSIKWTKRENFQK